MRSHLLAVALPLFLLVPFAASDTKAPAPLAKVAIVGASVSAGFGLDPSADPMLGEKSKVTLARIVDASILGAHATPVDQSDLMFFTAAKASAKRAVKNAAAAKPSMLVALDYVFWLGYGDGDPKQRLDRLADGLKALESVRCPVLLGDFPDFNGTTVDPMMLPPNSIPSKETVAKLNAACRAWAQGRDNVIVVPVSELFRKLAAGEAIEVGGNALGADARARLMQRDGLHTTLEGTCALWALGVDTWLATKPAGVDAQSLLLDVPALAKKASAPPAEASAPKDKREKKLQKTHAGG
ncbi:MAG: hypothetical protein HZA52_17530 [Planctomycetes bacterium]|nr:hypothetical protein [Planctomycetota bacterium]